MLLNNLFSLLTLEATNSTALAELELDSSNKIFDGHFPGHPVVPGVCMMQMVKEIVEQITGESTRLAKANSLKFLTVLNPLENKRVQVNMKFSRQEKSVSVDAQILDNTNLFFKFKGVFLID